MKSLSLSLTVPQNDASIACQYRVPSLSRIRPQIVQPETKSARLPPSASTFSQRLKGPGWFRVVGARASLHPSAQRGEKKTNEHRIQRTSQANPGARCSSCFRSGHPRGGLGFRPLSDGKAAAALQPSSIHHSLFTTRAQFRITQINSRIGGKKNTSARGPN